jgi:hypothetical protein
MSKELFFFLTLIASFYGFAQVSENFEDESLGSTPSTFNPAWSGTTDKFILVDDGGNKRLRSNAGQLASSGSYYISTPSSALNNSVWEFFVNLKFATSGTNYVEFFLVADDADPSFVQNAYILRIGETADRIVLYRRQVVTYTELLSSAAGVVNSSSNNPFKIRVTRDAIGNWALFYDKGASGTFTEVGSILDNTITSTTNFILNIEQSTAASPSNAHFFDDFNVGTDMEGPEIVSASAMNSTTVDLRFNEVVEETTAESISNYALTNGATISAATLDGSDAALVHLTTSVLTNGQGYTLTVNNVEDVNGNVIMSNSTYDFTYLVFSTAGFRDVVINEFMADPSPPEGLPETDFVELYNPTDQYFDLTGWRIGDNSSSSTPLASHVLSPGGYLIICPTSPTNFVPQFEGYGDTKGVGSFPNFNATSADQVVLYNSSGDVIDQVSYSKPPANGISYEQVNPELACSGEFNFRPSEASIGGTPGAANSVLLIVPDNFGPNIQLVKALSADSVRIDFDETINGAMVPTAIITASPAISISDKKYLPGYPNSIFLKLAEVLTPNAPYEVAVSEISDCSGNSIDQSTGTLILGLTPPSDAILLSEVLFNPRSGGADFVEIFNPSVTNNYELRGWQLARMVNGVIDSPKPIAAESQLIHPRDFLVFSTNPENVAIEYPQGSPEKYIKLGSMPSYNDDEGVVVLLNDADEIVQRFDYKEEYHYTLLEDEEGVSLERIAYDKEVNDPNNWRSAASTVGFATPGRPNSQSKEFAAKSGKISIDPKVFLPGNSGTGRDFTTINYQLSSGGQFANIMIYDQQGRPVKQLANGASLATEGFFRWDGTTDRGGMARMGYYLVIFELYSGTGKTQTLKETVVVGRDF